MDIFLNAGSTMVILFLIIALGFLARKIKLVNDDFDATLSKVVMNITCPAMILNSVLSNTEIPDDALVLQIILVSCVTYLAVLLVAFLVPKIYRVPARARGAHSFVIAFGNTGFIGFAVLGAILGGQSVLYAAIYNIPYNLILFTFGAMMIANSGSVEVSKEERRHTLVRSLFSPVMISCLVALALALLHVSDFGVVGRTCEMLGSMTPPAAMLVIGSSLAKLSIRTMLGNGYAYVTTFIRLLLIPVMVYFLASLMTSDPLILASITLVSAMPVATMGTMMCLTYGGDLTTMSQATFLTTVLSVITIPLITVFVMMM